MDIWPKLALITGIFSLSFMLNLPFGYLRRATRKFSFWWFLCIHAPIPFVFLGRTLSHLDYMYIPFFVLAAVIGQVWGGRLEF